MANAPSSTPNWTDLLDELKRIAEALENPRFEEVSDEVPAVAAARHVDYLAVRQLMGHDPRADEFRAVFPAARRNGSGKRTVLVLTDIPDDAEKVAVFTGRGQEAEVIDLGGHVTTYRSSWKPCEYTLAHVPTDQVITRLEFRRGDDYPVGLGPRLAPV